LNQHERTRTLLEMRRGRVRTLVATDVAARGIDVAGISHVINFDLPRQAGDYVHRIGARVAPARQASPCRSRTTRNAARCARSSDLLALRFPRWKSPGWSRAGASPASLRERGSPSRRSGVRQRRSMLGLRHAGTIAPDRVRAGVVNGTREHPLPGSAGASPRRATACADGARLQPSPRFLSTPAPAPCCAADRWRQKTGCRRAPCHRATARRR